ncbi:MAG: aminoacyl-tRNA hydrolase [Limisphaerales bacterium]|jgi:PTH1 family peptidyl-tRNA hydrolase
MDAPALIVGLGNPGSKYEGTRHNVGFFVVERLAERWGASWEESGRFRSRVACVRRGGSAVWLCEPDTYMNLSGEAVGPLQRYYRIPLERVLVVVDDADLPLGSVRMRGRGGSGGHHGLESVTEGLGGDGYSRQRVGIGRRDEQGRELAGYVLGKFTSAEREYLEPVLVRAVDQVETWLTDGVESAMNKFNGMVSNAKA